MSSTEQYRDSLNNVLSSVGTGVEKYDAALATTDSNGAGLAKLIGGQLTAVQQVHNTSAEVNKLALKMTAGIDGASMDIHTGACNLLSVTAESGSAQVRGALKDIGALYSGNDTPIGTGREVLLNIINVETFEISALLTEVAQRLGALQDLAVQFSDTDPSSSAADLHEGAVTAAAKLQQYGDTIGTPLTVPANLQ